MLSLKNSLRERDTTQRQLPCRNAMPPSPETMAILQMCKMAVRKCAITPTPAAAILKEDKLQDIERQMLETVGAEGEPHPHTIYCPSHWTTPVGQQILPKDQEQKPRPTTQGPLMVED